MAGVAFYEHEPWQIGEMKWELSHEAKVRDVRMCVSARCADDELIVRVAATNLSDATWTNQWLNCCLGLWDTVEFGGDKGMVRTFAVHDGALKPLAEINPWAGADSLKTFYPLVGVPHTAYWNTVTEIRKLCPERVDEGFIATAGTTGAAVGLGWDAPAQCVFNNTDSAFQCIHVAPFIDAVAPGETFTAQGKVYFSRSGPGECLERFRADFGRSAL